MNKPVVYIGTSGYYYEDWRSVFYPPDLPKSEMLTFYSRHFNAVEINATYYKIPDQKTFQRLADNTPDDFQIMVKTHQETTHRRRENAAAIQQISEVVQPIIEKGKFRGFLAQFPYSFKNNEANRKYVVQTRNLLSGKPLFVEFRHESWLKPQVVTFLHENEVGYVNVDQPRLKGLLPPQDIVTNTTGYIRMHGRNEINWWEGRGSERYNYEYPEEELKEWLKHISNILQKTYKTYIFFNNHPTGHAVKNARQMIEILQTALL